MYRCYLTEPADVNTLLRLSNGVQTASQYSGRVEVYNQGQWGTVCSNGFDNNDAQAICNMFKYKYVMASIIMMLKPYATCSDTSTYSAVYHIAVQFRNSNTQNLVADLAPLPSPKPIL